MKLVLLFFILVFRVFEDLHVNPDRATSLFFNEVVHLLLLADLCLDDLTIQLLIHHILEPILSVTSLQRLIRELHKTCDEEEQLLVVCQCKCSILLWLSKTWRQVDPILLDLPENLRLQGSQTVLFLVGVRPAHHERQPSVQLRY